MGRRVRPTIAISMGDPAGIGPEILLKALLKPSVERSARIIVVGSRSKLGTTARRLGLAVRITEAGIRLPGGRVVSVIDVDTTRSQVPLGRPSRQGGEIAGKAVEEAVRLALSGEVDGIVTSPVSKEALALAGYGMVGHTEILARLTGTTDYAMMLIRRRLRIVFVTGHVAHKSVARKLRSDRILRCVKLANRYIDLYFGIAKPHLGVACLNPHCGEGGLMGDEERRIIRPAVVAARRGGIDVEGPFPADYLLSDPVSATFDGIIAMYHDQGMIALRSQGFDDVVNITLGIPIVRTSPGHGTAFEIAGSGEASEASMVSAIRQCVSIIKRLRDAG